MEKRVTKLLLCIFAIFVIMPMNIVFANSKIDLIVEGKSMKLDQAPVIEKGRVMVPLRGIFEALGAEMEWDSLTNTITGKKEETVVKLQLESDLAYLNDKEIELDVPAKLINGRTMVPIRFIAESLGVKVDWDSHHQRVTVGKDLEFLSEESLSEQDVYKNIIALKKQYPEGMPWTNSNYYAWNGGVFSGGYGCAGFAFLLSDQAFGSLSAREHHDFTNLRVGDILRINNDTHSVIILKIEGENITIAEGNYNSSVHWGRIISLDEIKNIGNYVLTRYPE